MAKQITSTEIKKILKVGNVIIGTNRALKELKLGRVEKIFISSNCPSNVEKSILYYSALNGTEAVKLQHSNEEIGVICKKPFSVSVLGVLKAS